MANNETCTAFDDLYDKSIHESKSCSITLKQNECCIDGYNYYYWLTECHCKPKKPVRVFYHISHVCKPHSKKDRNHGFLRMSLYMRCYCGYEKRSFMNN